MNINFPPVDEHFIKSSVECGYYSNATELVRDAVRRMRESSAQRPKTLWDALEEGEADVRTGRTVPYTPELLEKITQEAHQDFLNGVRPDPDVCP